jgi:structural maintenance of chromosome 2
VLELESLKAELVAAKEALTVAERALDDAMSDESQTQMNVGHTQAVYEETRANLDGLEKLVTSCTSEVVELKRGKQDLAKEAEKATLEAKRLSVKIAHVQKDRAGAEHAVAALFKKFAWIESEKSAFGVPGGDYDFEATDPTEAGRHLKALKGEQDSLVCFFSVFPSS